MRISGRGAAALSVVGWFAIASCGGDDATPGATTGDDGGGGDGALADDGGGAGDGPSAEGSAPKPGRFLFARSLPAAAGPIAALPSGGWAVFVEILHSTTIANTTITRTGRDDAALVKLDEKGDPVWVKPMIGPGDDNRVSLAVDDDGSIYVAGLSISGTSMDFGDGVTTSSPSPSNAQWAWYAKYDANGTAQWARGIGADLGLGSVHIAARGGRVAVSGYYSEPKLRYEGTGGAVLAPAFGNYPVFVFSCGAADGLVASMARLDGPAGDAALTVDATGRAVVTGSFASAKITKEPTGDVVAHVGSGSDAYAVAFDAAGAVSWSRAFGAVGADAAGITVGAFGLVNDANGHLVLGGGFGAPTDFGKGTRNVLGASDPFLLGLDPATGATLWDKEIGNDGNDGYGYLALAPGGEVVTLGGLAADATPLSIDGVPLASTPGPYVDKLSASNQLAWVWHTMVTAPNAVHLAAVAANGKGEVAVTGGVKGTVDFGGGPIDESDSGFEDMFVLGVADP